MRIDAFKGAVVFAAGASLLSTEAALAYPDVTPTEVNVNSNGTYTNEFTLTEHCSRASQLVGNVAVNAQQADANPSLTQSESLGFDKILQFGVGVCGADNKIVSSGVITRDKATGEVLKVTLRAAGLEITRPLFNQSSSANCTSLRTTDTVQQISFKRGETIINNMRGKNVPCDTGFVTANGVSGKPADTDYVNFFPPVIKTSEAVLTYDPKLDEAIAKTNQARFRMLRGALHRKFLPRGGKAPVVIVGPNSKEAEKRRTEYKNMTDQVAPTEAPIVTPDSNGAVANMQRDDVIATARLLELKPLSQATGRFIIKEVKLANLAKIR